MHKWHPFNAELAARYEEDGNLETFKQLLYSAIEDAKEQELPMYRGRFHDRKYDPGAYLRHCILHDIAFTILESPSRFQTAWGELRQLGKEGSYSDEDVDRCIEVMLTELDAMYANAVRLFGE